MAVINYSSYAQAVEKGMSKRNMTGMAKVLFAFMCNHEDVVQRRITKADEKRGDMDVHYSVPDGEAIEWYRGLRDVSETLRNGAGNTDIIAEAPGYFEEHVLTDLINPQKEEQAIKAVKELVSEAENLDDNLRKSWLDECDNGDIGAFLAHVFLYAVPQSNVVSEIDEEIVAPILDEEDEKEIRLFESLVVKHAKPEPDEPPLEIAEKEIEYVKQLLLAYADAEHVSYIDRSDLESIPRYSKYKNNFERSRRDFYSAEKVRESAKDILKLNEKDGFDLVKKEVLDGVVDVWEIYASSDGFTRMLQVMSKATDVNITANTKRRLLEWIGNAEKKGICHVLVGENKLWWVDNAENL